MRLVHLFIRNNAANARNFNHKIVTREANCGKPQCIFVGVNLFEVNVYETPAMLPSTVQLKFSLSLFLHLNHVLRFHLLFVISIVFLIWCFATGAWTHYHVNSNMLSPIWYVSIFDTDTAFHRKCAVATTHRSKRRHTLFDHRSFCFQHRFGALASFYFSSPWFSALCNNMICEWSGPFSILVCVWIAETLLLTTFHFFRSVELKPERILTGTWNIHIIKGFKIKWYSAADEKNGGWVFGVHWWMESCWFVPEVNILGTLNEAQLNIRMVFT